MKVLSVVCSVLTLFILVFTSQYVPASELQKTTSISNQQCIECHQSEQQAWQHSDHAKSMALADKSSVLGDFNQKHVEHHGQKALFFIADGVYQVTISYDDNSQTLPIKFTFGHFPLQQYLVETEHGKLQVLPFAWDSRIKEAGGQRWYHNYSQEEIRPEDRLHWRQPLQNWNGMCADCHSDGLVRNYDEPNNRFDSQFDNINVGCLSCHGDMTVHADKKSSTARNNDVTSIKSPTGKWLRSIGEKTAHWQGEQRDNGFMDNCFSCHSLRSPLTDGIKPHTAFLDQFTPQLLAAPNYYPDGQIKEEVYVYGSFLQSKMFAAGVNCLDCHDQHTMKLKAEGNGLCLQCHGAEIYNAKTHHQHQVNSAGAQCVNCHMPTNRYMGVDDRRDHSFKIPRPDLSISHNSPNACTSCHEEKNNQWAAKQLEEWHGKPQTVASSKQHLMALNSGQIISLQQHLTIVSDEQLDVISRATALQLLSMSTQSITADILKPFLSHQEALIRLAAANAAVLLPANDKVTFVAPLLADQYKAIRVAAARSLVDSQLMLSDSTVFKQAFNAMQAAHQVSSWRGEGKLNQGLIAYESGDLSATEKAFKGAVKVDPYFETGYINLADLYRAQQRPALVMSVLRKGLANLPKSATINYAYGLHLVRQQKTAQAVAYFKKAMVLQQLDQQYAYTFVLALDGIGKSKQALKELKQLILAYPERSQLKELGLYLSQKLQSQSDYYWFQKA